MNKIHIKNLRIGVEECRNMTPNKCRCHFTNTLWLQFVKQSRNEFIDWEMFGIHRIMSISSFFWKKDLCAYLVFWKNRVHSRRQKVLAVARVTHYSLMFESHRGPVVFMFSMLCIENQTIKWFSFISWLCLRFVLASKQIHLEQFYGNREDYRADWACREKHWHSTVALE